MKRALTLLILVAAVSGCATIKGWFSDEVGERWGAVYVWESQESSEQELPSRARELIGKNPDIVEVFDLEASVSVASQLARLGLALD